MSLHTCSEENCRSRCILMCLADIWLKAMPQGYENEMAKSRQFAILLASSVGGIPICRSASASASASALALAPVRSLVQDPNSTTSLRFFRAREPSANDG